MSNLFKYTKRVLTSVLAAAVVLTAIPSTAFGAELPDEDFAEVVEVQEAEVADEAVVEEEAAATDGTGNEEEVIIEGEEENPDQSKDDLTLTFVLQENTASSVKVYSPNQSDTLTAIGYTDKAGWKDHAAAATNNNAFDLAVDSEKDLVLFVEPKAGSKLADKVAPVISYDDYSKKTTGAADTVELTEESDPKASTMYEAVTYADYVADGLNRGTVKLTISSTTLKNIVSKYTYKDATSPAAAAEAVIELAPATQDTFTIGWSCTATGFTPGGHALNRENVGTPIARDVKAQDAGNTNNGLFPVDTTLQIAKFKVTGIVKDKSGKVIAEKAAIVSNDGSLDTAEMGDSKDEGTQWKDVEWIGFDTKDEGSIGITGSATSLAYQNDRTITIAIDASEAGAAEKYLVTVNGDYVKFYNGTTTGSDATALPATEGHEEDVKAIANTDYNVRVVPKAASLTGTRTIKEVTYTVGGKTEKATVTFDSSDSDKPGYITIPAEKVTGPISVTATTYEEVLAPVVLAEADGSPLSNAATVINTDGTVAEKAATGEVYSFGVRANGKYVIKKVEYQIGAEGTKKEAALNNGVYSTKEAVNDTLRLTVTVAMGAEEYTVETAADYDAGGIADVSAMNGAAAVAITDTNKANVPANTTFTFQVAPKSGKAIKAVTYTMGSSTAVLKPTALAKAGYYSIANVTGNVVITVTTDDMLTIALPKNKNIKFYLNGSTTAIPDDQTTISVSDAQNMSFRVESKKSNIAIKDIYYYPLSYIAAAKATDFADADFEDVKTGKGLTNTVTYSTTKIGTGEGTYTINIPTVKGSAAVTTAAGYDDDGGTKPIEANHIYTYYGANGTFGPMGLGLYVETEETVDPTTYRVRFEADNETYATPDSKIEYDFIDKDGVKTNIDNLKSQKLWLVVGETADLAGATESKLFIKNSTGSYPASATADTSSSNYDWTFSSTTTGSTAVLDWTLSDAEGKTVGTDTITAKAVYYDPLVDDGAKKVYTDTLPVEVVNLFDSVYVEMDDSGDPAPAVKGVIAGAGSVGNVGVFGVDGRTKEVYRLAITSGSTAADVKSVELAFDPDIANDNKKTYYYGSSKLGYKKFDISGDDASIALYATKAQSSPIKMTAKVTLGNGTVLNATPKSLYIADKDAVTNNYFIFSTVTGANRADAVNYVYSSYGDQEVLHRTSSKLNSISAKYRVFEITNTGLAQEGGDMDAFRATFTDEKTLQDAVTDGYLIDITDDVVFDQTSEVLANYNTSDAEATPGTDDAKAVYATLSGSKGNYTITAAEKTSPLTGFGATTQLHPVIRLDNVLIDDKSLGSVPPIAVSVENKTKTYTVDFYTEDVTSAGKVYENHLTDAYLTGKGATSDIKYVVGGDKGGLVQAGGGPTYVEFSTDTVGTGDTELIGKYRGVALTAVETGTAIKLPDNKGFTAVQSKRTLAGWAIINVANDKLLGYVDPGTEVTILGDTRFVAVWANKFDTSLFSFNNGNLLVEADADSYDGAGDAEIGPDGEPIQENTYPEPIAGAIFATGAKVPVVLVVPEVKGIASKTKTTDVLDPATDYNYKTHYLTSTNDFTVAEDGDEGVFTLSGNTMNVTAGGSTNAKLKGVFKDGSDSYDVTSTVACNPAFSTTAAAAWSLKIGDVSPFEAGTDPVTVEISEFKIAGTSVLSDLNPTSVDIDPYKVEWKITKNDSKATIESDKTIHHDPSPATTITITDAEKATLTGLSAGEIEVSVTVTDKDGISATATKAVTINPAAYSIVVEDANGTVIGDSAFLEVAANRANKLAGATSFKVKAVATGSTTGVPGGTWAYRANEDDGAGKEIVGTPIGFEAGTNNYQIGYMATNNVVGEDDVVVEWTTSDGTKYRKVVKLKSYYTVTLNGIAGSPAPSGSYYYVTNADGSVIYKKGGTGSDKNDPTTATIKLFADKAIKDKAGNITHYGPVSLADYNAVYYNADGEADNSKELMGWDTAATLDGTVYGTSIEKLTKSTFASNGNLNLYTNMIEYVSAVGWPTSTVVLSNEAGKTNYKEVTLQVTPPTGSAEIRLTADKVGTYTMFAGTVKDDYLGSQNYTTTTGAYSLDPSIPIGSGVYPYVGADVVAKATTTGSPATSRKDTFTIGAMEEKAGKFTVSVYSTPGTSIASLPEGTAPLGTFTVIVSGLTVNPDGTKSYIKTTGEKAVSEAITIGTDTYYFDEEGNAITTEGITTINGKKVLIVSGGALAPKGAYPYKSDMYAIGDNGEILSGWVTSTFTKASGASDGVYYADPANGDKLANDLYKVGNDFYIFKSYVKQTAPAGTAGYVPYKLSDTVTKYIDVNGKVAMATLISVDGKQYLVNEDGNLVTYAMTTDGKYKLGNMTYIIDKDTNEAKPDKKMVNAKFNWTTKKPAKFQKSDPAPTNTWEITYNFEGETATQKATGSVIAVADPADYATKLDVRKVTFTFTASESDLAGFFSDSKGEKALTASPAVWTFNFNGGSDIGTGGGIEVVGFDEGQEFKFTGGAIKPPVEVWDNDLGEKLVLGVDYSLSYKNNTKITTDSSKMPTLTVVGKGNYAGKNVTRTFKIVNPIEGETGLTTTVKSVVLGFTTTPVYNGEEWYPDTITVDGNGFSHSSGDSYTTDTTANYVFTFSSNVDAGTATVGVTGQDGKTKKKTFKINKVDLSKVSTANLEISPADAEWTVKGAVPATTVTYTPEGGSAITLVEGQDYTLKVNYADKKKNVAEGNTVTITGKGANFAKKATSTETFAITPYTITDDNLLEVVAPAGAKVKSVKTTVVDKNGVKIDKKNFAAVNVYDSTSTLLAPTASLTAGQTYKVEVVAPPTGNIDGSASFEFVAAADMSKAKVTLSSDLKKNGVAYTGEAIDITNIQSGELIKNLFTTGDITVEYKNPSTKKYEKLTWDEDFEVVGYQNNVKKGTMTVFIRAKDDSTKVSGVKNFKIKISAKTMQKAQ